MVSFMTARWTFFSLIGMVSILFLGLNSRKWSDYGLLCLGWLIYFLRPTKTCLLSNVLNMFYTVLLILGYLLSIFSVIYVICIVRYYLRLHYLYLIFSFCRGCKLLRSIFLSIAGYVLLSFSRLVSKTSILDSSSNFSSQ